MRIAFLLRPLFSRFSGPSLGAISSCRRRAFLFHIPAARPGGLRTMDEKLVDFLWEEITRLDEAIVDLGDALDVKASIVLVLATLLGAISGPILALHDLPDWVKVAQAIAVAALGFTVICA